jgi:hypothetical protein
MITWNKIMYLLSKCKFCLIILCLTFSACSSGDKLGKTEILKDEEVPVKEVNQTVKKGIVLLDDNGKLGDLFKGGDDEIGSVNKYLWQASLEVLSFLPITSADPFSGIIVFGKGKAPGSIQSYDATVYISDPALDARSLNVTVRSSNGTISLEAKREIEIAILSRARQLRLKELDL